jgi:hypothetical protein
MYKKPETIKEITDFLSITIQKVLHLKAASFGKFTEKHLADDYLYRKWIGKDKDFADVYLNMDNDHQRLFIKYVLEEDNEEDFYLSTVLHRFFLFCWNWDSREFTENPFGGKYKDLLCKAATGKTKPSGITSKQVQRLFHKLDDNGKAYLTWCVFGAKK